eukprot:273624_1
MSAEQYQQLCKFGKYGGTYWKAKDKVNGHIVRLKEITSFLRYGEKYEENQHVKIWKELNHANILPLFDVIHHEQENDEFEAGYKKRMWLICEWMENMDLPQTIYKQRELINGVIVKSYLHQLLNGIHYLHQKGIVHNCLRPNNLLLNDNYKTLKICDLYYSIHYSTCSQIDMLSIGIIFVSILTGLELFPSCYDTKSMFPNMFNEYKSIIMPLFNENNASKKQFMNNLKQWENDLMKHKGYVSWSKDNNYDNKKMNLSWLGADLLVSLLRYDPNQRITAKQALKHSFFIEEKLMCYGYIRMLEKQSKILLSADLIELCAKFVGQKVEYSNSYHFVR